MSKTRVFIYGSCVSRDTFEHLDPEQFELVEYVARQSALSATTRPVELLAPPTLASRFQQRMVDGDFASSLRPLLAQHAGGTDVLLIDLTDERLGAYLLPDGTVVTRSVELIESGLERSLPQGAHHLAFGTQQHYEYWSGAVRALGDAVRNTMPQVAVALLDIPWAEWSESGQQTPSSFGVSAAQANPTFRPYMEVAAQALGAHVISLEPTEVMSGPHHPWGDAPFHYAESVYLDIVKRLTGAEGRVIWGSGATTRTMTADLPAQQPGAAVATPSTGSRAEVRERAAGAQGAQSPAAPLRRLEGGPNFLIAGTQRGGTQWLQQQLNVHPQIFLMKAAGQFFNQSRKTSSPSEIQKYIAQFEPGINKPLRGERTPGYFWQTAKGPFSPQRKHDTAAAVRDMLDPNAPVLLTLRHPVHRAVSAYWSEFSQANIDLDARIFQVDAATGIVDRGFYRRHYEHWARTIGDNRLHVLVFDDLVKKPHEYLAQALQALGAQDSPQFWNAVRPKKRFGNLPFLAPFKAKNSVTNQELAALLELYREDIEFLEHLLRRDLSSWKNLDELIKWNTGYNKKR